MGRVSATPNLQEWEGLPPTGLGTCVGTDAAARRGINASASCWRAAWLMRAPCTLRWAGGGPCGFAEPTPGTWLCHDLPACDGTAREQLCCRDKLFHGPETFEPVIGALTAGRCCELDFQSSSPKHSLYCGHRLGSSAARRLRGLASFSGRACSQAALLPLQFLGPGAGTCTGPLSCPALSRWELGRQLFLFKAQPLQEAVFSEL